MNRPRYHILLIAFVGFLAYSNTFTVPFHFDDNQNIEQNPIVKDLRYFADPSAAAKFRFYSALRSRFIGYLSFALNYQLNGLDVTGYHIVNLAIHIINALLVYWLTLLTFRTPYCARVPGSFVPSLENGGAVDGKQRGISIALFSALLFVSHPLQTQAVTYIVQRFASLAALFFLLSLIFYIQWRTVSFSAPGTVRRAFLSPSASRFASALLYLASLLFAVLAMKTKEIAITLPVVIMLYEFLFFEGTTPKRVVYLIPFLLTMLIVPFSILSVDRPIGELIGDMGDAARARSALSRWDYLFTQFRVIVTYLRLIVLPLHQNLDYDYPVYHSFLDADVFLSFLFLSAIAGLAVYLVYRSRLTPSALRLAAFGIFWFFITLSVESSLIPIDDVIVEHRLYLPLVGVFMAGVTSLLLMVNTFIERRRTADTTLVLLLIPVIVVLSSASYARNTVWQSRVGLWESVAELSPRKARVHNNLGQAYSAAGMTEKAREHYTITLELDPDNAVAHFNLGISYLGTGNIHDARRQFETALRIMPDFQPARQFLSYVSKLNNNGNDPQNAVGR